MLVDRFRTDVATIDRVLTKRETRIDSDAQRSIDQIGLLTAGAVTIVLLISLLYAVQQAALAVRVEIERIHAAEQLHEADVLRAAYTTEKRIADTLQQAFVQRPLPTHPTLRFSATYVPASEEAKVGGDWYDALELPGNRVLFAIGDVTGHGITAAVTMNRVRQALITSALLDPMPAALLERVARELYAEKAPLVTAVAGFADANTYEFIYASAGHHRRRCCSNPERPPRMLEFRFLLRLGRWLPKRLSNVPRPERARRDAGALHRRRDRTLARRDRRRDDLPGCRFQEAARTAPPRPTLPRSFTTPSFRRSRKSATTSRSSRSASPTILGRGGHAHLRATARKPRVEGAACPRCRPKRRTRHESRPDARRRADARANRSQ